ncbi:DegV family protein [Mycoplasma sp. Mirounga ES2805-ORL]|uniref:DegV family protein n=1 Tax=Mycoplasma sp. Mirounga ES2805-ORL TaxID=754514 RepID=UPI00197B92F5|nr:DegV family protein [Mycoplasma sp. Mirounga ES2805-ORL]QSF13554.1 DegV family protein [Mycoplasma sp. Mirounga ES2805-ORL]
MKYAIVIDSSSGLTKKQAEKLGWFYLPLYITIDGKEYADGVELTSRNLFDKYTLKSDVKTSTFNMGEAYNLFSDLSKTYDKIFVYSISKNLSSSYINFKSMENEFPKLKVIESIQITYLIPFDIVWFEHKMKEDSSKYEEYIQYIENGGFKKECSLIPKYNKYLIKGGRLHPSAAAIARLLKIVPIIKWENGSLLKESIGRSFEKTCIKLIKSKAKDFEVEPGHELMVSYIHSGPKPDDLQLFQNTFKEEFEEIPFTEFISPVVSVHTGPEAFVIILVSMPKWLKQEFLEKYEQIKNIQ